MKNEGKSDRILRIVLGVFLLVLVFFGPKTAWGYIGVIPLITGLWGFCPIYKIFKIKTYSET